MCCLKVEGGGTSGPDKELGAGDQLEQFCLDFSLKTKVSDEILASICTEMSRSNNQIIIPYTTCNISAK